MRCPHCSKSVATHNGNCVHCGRPVQALLERPRAIIQCPRCALDAEIISLGPVDVDSCATCGNMWFDNSELERATAAADGTVGADLRDAVRALIPIRSAAPGPSTVPCPFCMAALVRRSHPTVPDVVAHVCSAHGAWLERTHLLRLLEDIEAQGLTALRARDKLRADQNAERNRRANDELELTRRLARNRLAHSHVWFWFF